MGIAAGFMLSYVWGLMIGGGLTLSKRLGGLDTRRIAVTVILLHTAAVPGVMAAWSLQRFWFGTDTGSLVALVIGPLVGCAVAAALYLVSAYLLRIEEVRQAWAQFGSRARGARGRSNSGPTPG